MATTTRLSGPPCEVVQWPKTALRVTFGVIWLIDAGLKWLPGFRSGYMDTIMGQAQGQPGWLQPWFRFWIDLQHPHPYFFAYLVAVIETLIAVAVIVGFARKLTYSAAIVFSLLVWATAEGFGGPYAAGSADIGTAVIYALVFGFLLLFSYYTGPSAHSVDVHLEQRISWWHRVAEVEPRRRRIARLAARHARVVPLVERSLIVPDMAGPTQLIPAQQSHAHRSKVSSGRR
jgi:thiosulfate dehydrogenase [quinone] large subunit